MRKVAILSTASFFRPGPRISMQFIAQILARNDFDVHYISQPSSPLDAFSPGRRQRFQRAWLGKEPCLQVERNLKEYFVRAPFPVSKKFWVIPRQYDWYGCLLPRSLRTVHFDVCIHDVCSCFPLLEYLSFDKLILRLNDHPEGFGYAASQIVIQRLLRHLARGRYQQIWSVSQALRDYAVQLNPGGTHVLLSNGVDYQRFRRLPGTEPVMSPKSAVFVGALDHWVDLALLDETAKLLGDWHFDVYGPAAKRTGTRLSAANLSYQGPVAYQDLPKVLARYQVGLIPFKEEPLIAMMERPLKFYEYLAAGLGIAATAVGMLETGMGSWAHYGRTPRTFADAIVKAARDSGQELQARYAFLQDYSWSRIGAELLSCIDRSLVA